MNILEKLQEADKAWNVGTLATAIVEILKEHKEMTLLDIEDHLRTFSKTTYLVAWPKHLIPVEVQDKGVRHKQVPRNMVTGEEMEYAVWICINGPNDMLQQLDEFGLTIEENREALKKTGFNVIL